MTCLKKIIIFSKVLMDEGAHSLRVLFEKKP
jgi:hypothetical protein